MFRVFVGDGNTTQLCGDSSVAILAQAVLIAQLTAVCVYTASSLLPCHLCSGCYLIMRSFAPQTRSQANRLTSDLQGTAAHGPDPEFLRQVFGGSVDPNVPLGVSPNDAHKAIMVRAITNAAGVLFVPLSFAQMDSLVATSTALNTTYSPGKIPHKQANLVVPRGLPKLPVFVPEKAHDGYMRRCMIAFAPKIFTFTELPQIPSGKSANTHRCVFSRQLFSWLAAPHTSQKQSCKS